MYQAPPPFPPTLSLMMVWSTSAGGVYVRTWNLPALVMYLMPLKGLYFSPYMSSRFTFRPGDKGKAEVRFREQLRSVST